MISLPFSLIPLFASYAKTIIDGYSLFQILAVQKYIFTYHQTKIIAPFSFWDLLLLNRWHTWWGTKEIIRDIQWIIIWPVSFILTLFFSIFGILKKILISEEELIIILWIFVYCLFLSFGQTSTRYFPPILPFIYIIATSFVTKIILRYKRNLS